MYPKRLNITNNNNNIIQNLSTKGICRKIDKITAKKAPKHLSNAIKPCAALLDMVVFVTVLVLLRIFLLHQANETFVSKKRKERPNCKLL